MRGTLGVALLLALASVQPACDSKSKSTDSGGDSSGETSANETDSASPTRAGDMAKATDGPQPGGHLKLPSNEPRYLNPVLETRLEKATPLIFEGLVGLNSRLEPVPRLAESWEQSEDGKVITFHLRDDVKFHDGQPFTSADVAYTFRAIQESEVPTLWRAYTTAVETLATPDAETVVVTYRYPYAPALSSWTVGILPKHVYEQGKLADSPANREPVGTGPYKLARWEAGQRLVLQANPSWWYGRPLIDTIELDVSTPESVETLSAGGLDFANIDNIEDWLERAHMSDFRDNFEVSDVIESRIQLLAWNLERPKLDDARVRKALTLALDRSRVVEDVLLGQARLLSAPYFPTMFGADPGIAPHPFDLKAAAALLDEAGAKVKDGQRFSLSVIAPESQRSATADAVIAVFRENFEQIGVGFEVEYLPAREFFQRIEQRQFDAVYFTWLPDIPDPDPYSLLHSSMIGIGANFPAYGNAEVDKLLDDARASSDRATRRQLYQQVHAILHEELPYTPLFAPYGHYAWNRRVRGVNPGDVSSQERFPGVARWWVADAAE
ncbi:ABC transporter substrate-binding protein [Haliangium ochraceum]|uniref:Extracellular solute-binding protein family 5 n=1 Tax=Haliangium ochraceum (strain DSM 14365 / JCM 11303 / SMP-2) TaxID=502025 RepID=D0LQ65_HALO1|nr:ABC transporter substrate-binding protein [Haliangium ochraceum]ACY17102.1 extracellular solute-binding protein family 5 [Haliangium ochraceum DSM 14365]